MFVAIRRLIRRERPACFQIELRHGRFVRRNLISGNPENMPLPIDLHAEGR
jgi:hypothetical protein